MTAPTATTDTPLRQAWLQVSRIQAGRLAARPRERARLGALGGGAGPPGREIIGTWVTALLLGLKASTLLWMLLWL